MHQEFGGDGFCTSGPIEFRKGVGHAPYPNNPNPFLPVTVSPVNAQCSNASNGYAMANISKYTDLV